MESKFIDKAIKNVISGMSEDGAAQMVHDVIILKTAIGLMKKITDSLDDHINDYVEKNGPIDVKKVIDLGIIPPDVDYTFEDKGEKK